MRARGLLVALLLSGCALQSPPEREELRKQALPDYPIPAQYTGGAPVDGDVAGAWLASFRDTALVEMVNEALIANPDLRVAAARVEQASAAARLAGATLWPQVNAMARGGGKLSGDSSGLEGAGIFANWELDLWGRVRYGQESAKQVFASATLDTDYARQSMAALVAKGWFLALEARAQKAIALEMQQSSERLAALARDRLRVGRGDELEVRQADAQSATFRDVALQLDLAEQSALRSIEALLGRYPGATVALAPDLPVMPGPVPVGLPSQLLERRPDVIAAERRVAAAFNRVGEARTAKLPRISLTAAVSSISSELFVLQDRDNPVVSAGAAITQPLFLGGALQAQEEIRDAELKAAIADYGRVGARAFGEVESALSAGFNLEERLIALNRAVADNVRALELAETRYRVGSGDLRAVQQQQLALFAARSTLLRARAERLVQRVNLHLALGGGFE
ncbi:MAG TPA: efflux transporter outer membrane subunit [Burkholderiales bacterium]|jgi:NodT family efflux transporter outer membrane factor (OMF) lipoprotein|nr:efflux transporter outer membrane subunit [Burkholderiales bacterium]